ncbi:MAG: hypothetical protein MI862_14260 [Desulfobacterales bacterium]|nr:hypothetical protein [Desulfobacterales bacterium]
MTRQMTITNITTRILELPVQAVHSHGSGDITVVKTLILQIDTDAGITGFGEASPWSVFTGTAEANVAAINVYYTPFLLGADPLRAEHLLFLAEKEVVHCSEARAALETALLDIKGKAFNCSLSDLIGGACHEQIPLSFSVANPNFDEDLETVADLVSQGVRIFKLKTGFAEHTFDVMRLERLRKIYGNDVDLRVDYNQGMQPFESIPRIRDLEPFSPTFVEQPVLAAEREAMAEITRATDCPIMADESVFNARDAVTMIGLRGANIFSLKIMKAGGIRRAQEVAATGRAAGIACYGGCMFETGIAHAAGAHLMNSIPYLTLGCEFYMANFYLEEDILDRPFPVKDGKVVVPTGPGLGVEPDMDKIEKYTTSQSQWSV